MTPMTDQAIHIRNDWQQQEITALLAMPFNDLLFKAQSIHRAFHDPQKIQISTLLSIKTGGCPEDCTYCPQSVHYNTGLDTERLLDGATVVDAARRAKACGADRFCVGAAWRSPTDRNLERVAEMISAIKALGLETCATLGMLSEAQTHRLAAAGLDYYNHNLDTSPEFYGNVITTRTYQDRLTTLKRVKKAGIKVCCGGILGMGESRADRAALLRQLVNLDEHPESVPINLLVQVEGTPLYGTKALDNLEFIRTIAVARIIMPKSWLRLSAGRETMSEEMQALCFFAGANSVFYGEKLLTTANPKTERDADLFKRLDLQTISTRQ
ncbi:MAG: biotin synthase BioB [Chromatiales bacterium]|nr:biotin synthase BioB [Chromatiales bacterium]